MIARAGFALWADARSGTWPQGRRSSVTLVTESLRERCIRASAAYVETVLSPFSRTYPLQDGPRVRLRLASRGDAEAVRSLLTRRGLQASDLELGRLLLFDPTRRAVVCAFAPIDDAETLVGIGAIDLRDGAEPDTLVVDERLAGGLASLLGEALATRARAHGRRVA